MKKLIKLLSVISFLIALQACEGTSCDCQYVTYDRDSPNGQWRETYRSTWDASCGSETLDQSQYTHTDGSVTYSKTEIECS
jgi:hypothetical protein